MSCLLQSLFCRNTHLDPSDRLLPLKYRNCGYMEVFLWSLGIVLYSYLYSAQYLHVLQDSKRYMTQSTVQVESISQVTDIPLTESQRLKDDHLLRSLRFLNLPLGIGPNDRGPPF